MRILIINELYNGGGTEVQTIRERDYFVKQGHEVYVLTFDSQLPENLEGFELNIPLNYNGIWKALNRLICFRGISKQIRRIISKISPNVIHVNNIVNVRLSVANEIVNYPVIQTIRDYAAVCPKATCIYENGEECDGYRLSNCWECIKNSLGYIIKYIGLQKFNWIRINRFNAFVSPSQALADKCTLNGIKTVCLNNPFDFTKITDEGKSCGDKKIFLYYGYIALIKGVDLIFEAFDTIDTNNFEVWFVGKVDPQIEVSFQDKIKGRNYAIYQGEKTFSEIMELYKYVYCVIVPSKWIENYPNTVLEAIANRTMVIGSNRGGIPELITNKRLLFDIHDLQSIKISILTVLNFTDQEYNEIVETQFQEITINNTQKMYYKKLMELYSKIIN